MIFVWDPEVPLVVGDDIELPQLALIKNYTADCTQVRCDMFSMTLRDFSNKIHRFIQREISHAWKSYLC